MTSSGIETASANLVGPVCQRLEWFCARPSVHARFLNTLSLMEHIGSRKIMKSQMDGPLGSEVLKHLAEEARHAYFFKRAAKKVGETSDDYSAEGTLAPASARQYLGRLDAHIAHALGPDVHVEVPYLYTSMVIEFRAIWMYRLYQRVLSEHLPTLSLKSLLAEEEMHLSVMGGRLAALGEPVEERVAGFAEYEHGLFRTLWDAIDQAAEALH